MTQGFQLERPAPRAFTLPTSFAAPRPQAPRALAMAAAPKVVEPSQPAIVATADSADASTDQLIKSIALAAARMTDLVERQRAQDAIVEGLRTTIRELTRDKELAEEAARLHERRADDATGEVEQLKARWQSQCDEQDRLKASVNALLAMFGTSDLDAATPSPSR